MKPTRLVAIAAALAGSSAFAQTPAGVTLYGIIDVSVRSQTGLTAAYARTPDSSSVVASGVGPTSRWGLRGSEDLGGGQRATFNLESGINVDTGAAANAVTYFDRASVVGLAGGWGSIQLGRQNTLVADSVGLVDPIGLRFAGLNPNIQVTSLTGHQLGIEFGATGSTGASNRVNNSAKLAMPVGPVMARAMVSLGEINGSNRKNDSVGLGLDYLSDTLNVTAATTRFRDANERTLTASNVGASWRAGNTRVMLNWGRNTGQTSPTAETTNRILAAGVNQAITAQVDLIAGYYKVTRSRTGQVDDGFNRLMVFGEYKLSRRSKLFVELDHTRFNGNYLVTGAKGTAQGLSVGVTHTF